MKKQNYLGWLLLLLAIFIGSWQFIQNFYDQQVLSQHETYLEQKADLFIRLSENNQSLETIANKYVVDSEERITSLDEKGNILFDTYDSTLSGTRSKRPEVNAVLNGSALGRAVRMSPTLHKELLYVAIPIKEEGQLKNILRIAEPTANFLPSAQKMKHAIFLVYSLFWLILSGIILQILRRRNRPVETILPVIKKMIEQPDSPEIIMQSSPQWEELYQSVNVLSEQMSHTYQAYSASEKRLYTLLNELMIGVFIIDDDGQLLLMNATMQEQLGNFAAPLQRSFTESITDTQLIQMIYQINEGHPFIHEEIKTSHERVLDITLRYFEEANQILGVSYDLTRIRQLEKLQKDFVGNVSHELKTPVTSLIGFTETLLDGAKDDPETLTAFLKIMQKDAYRLESLIQEIIQLSKSADINYHIQTLNVKQVLQQLLADYTPIIQEKNLAVTLEGDPELTFTTKVEVFYPICKNLIENAINYSLPNGQINIQFAEKNGLVFQVQDFGIGIEKEEQTRIFERFYRVDKARARNSGGTGLGLAIVKDYVEILGGSIHVDSHLGVGSTFYVYLPVN
ncbi:sensor histidine kinase [Enterococcus saccharolyticus]|uniref:histidine kinase n=1 Tax=Enterococcus saccharolyticus subsp. saccharolyticus ATCC 43076 TaxID=1139996 RepID=S0JHD3_9ENTE|nr:ATP-binding protein [Enterococcus saccharolyticus]EOT27955.1 hypothetical protein OMQ_01869 [Enterococcus saccharolyticus subsp. saccharolyticus ATCC 43076]EOT77333.1 hypothetical protein I572_02245 [Enterococcus saccharolyticus subsp. saccharolyticus ATCC 43076]